MTLAEAQAACRAAGVDLRVSGKGASDCVDRIAPFCVGGTSGVRFDTSHELPFCANEAIDPAKAAALLKEAEQRQAALAFEHPSPWLWVGLAGAAALLAWAALR